MELKVCIQLRFGFLLTKKVQSSLNDCQGESWHTGGGRQQSVNRGWSEMPNGGWLPLSWHHPILLPSLSGQVLPLLRGATSLYTSGIMPTLAFPSASSTRAFLST
jgi:hypothetical protein